MDHSRRWQRILAVAAAGVALAVPAARAGAATTTSTVTVPGATITRVDVDATTSITVKATVARLDLWCTSNKLVANKATTAIPCDRLVSVTTTGLTGADTVVVNATGFGTRSYRTALIVKTGAGNDVISIRHRGDLTVWGGTGDDRIEAGLATGTHPVTELLQGEDGKDTITNLGFITATPVVATGPDDAAAKALGSTMRGGAGADRLVTDARRWSDVAIDATDQVTWNQGPATFSPERATTVAAPWTYDAATTDPSVAEVLRFGTATSLTAGCVTSADGLGRTTVGGLALPVGCAQRELKVLGTARAETFTYDQAVAGDRQGVRVNVSMGDGDDRATVRQPEGFASIAGGNGDDVLTVGMHNGRPTIDPATAASLDGGPGDDTLTNQGLVDPNPPPFDEFYFTYDPHLPVVPYPYQHFLKGGPGADRIVGAPTTWDELSIDPSDTVVDPGGPARITMATGTGADVATVRHGGDGATTLVTTTPTTGTRTWPLPLLTDSLIVDLGAGNDATTVQGRSTRTQTDLVSGAGTDRLTLRPAAGWYTDENPPYAVLWHPMSRAIAWSTADTESVTIVPPA